MNPFSNVLHYFSVFKRYVGNRLYLVLLLTLVAGITDVLGIAMLLPLLAALEMGGDAGGGVTKVVFGVIERMGLSASPATILLLVGGLSLLKALIQYSNSAYQAVLGAKLFYELRSRLFDAYGKMDYLYYARNSTGHFTNVILSQANQFYASFITFTTFLSKVITVVIYLAVALALAWQIGVAAIVVGALMFFLFRKLNASVRERSRQTSREGRNLNKLLVQALQAFKYLASTDQIRSVRTGVMTSIRRMADYYIRDRMASAFTSTIKEPMSMLLIIGIVIFHITVLHEPIAPLLVALLLINRAMSSILSLQGTWQTLLSGIGAVEMVRDEFEALRVHSEHGGSEVVGTLAKHIEFRNVHFAYNATHGDVLRDVSLTIPARSTVAFVGESGAGKSTMVDLLTLLLKPRAGSILIDGVDSREVDLASWRSQIGYVSQDTVVFDDTIAANISLSLQNRAVKDDPEVFARIVEVAQRANIHTFIERLPEGYDTVVGERGVRLSGGQRQRLFIARELFKRPNLLILDEATSALDTEAERAVQESIDALHGEMTVVMIAHRLSTIRNVDRVYVLEHGQVVEDGPFAELRERQGSRFGKMIKLQAI